MAFIVEELRDGPVVVLRPRGRLTLGEGDIALRDAIAKHLNDGAPLIVLDLGDVSYVDSAGVGGLVSAYTTVTSRGGKLVLASPTKKLTDLLQITKLLTVFDTYSSVDEAAEALKQTAAE